MKRTLAMLALLAACSGGADENTPKEPEHPAADLGRRWAAALTAGNDAEYRTLFVPSLQTSPNPYVGERAMLFWLGEWRELEKRGYSGQWEFRDEGRGQMLNGARVAGVIYPILEDKPHYAGITIAEIGGSLRIVKLF